MPYPIRHPVTFLHRVFQPELQRVHPQLLRQFIDDRLHGKGGLGLTGRAVPLDLRLVTDHVVPIDEHMLHAVGAKTCQGATAHR